MSGVKTCADVSYDMRGAVAGDPAFDADVGDLLWNPKAGDGHVLVAEVRCGAKHEGRTVDCGCGGWGYGPCPSTTLVCQCGEDGSFRDHHYEILARNDEGPAAMSDTGSDSRELSDLDAVRALLDRVGVVYDDETGREGREGRWLTIHQGTGPKNAGYHGFSTFIQFDSDGQLVRWGAWE